MKTIKKATTAKAKTKFNGPFSGIDFDSEKAAGPKKLGVNCNHIVFNRWYGTFSKIGDPIETACRGKGTILVLKRWVPEYDWDTQTYYWRIVKGSKVVWVNTSSFFICDKDGCRPITGLPKVIRGILMQHIGARIVIDTEKVGGNVTIGKWYFADALPFPIPDPPATN